MGAGDGTVRGATAGADRKTATTREGRGALLAPLGASGRSERWFADDPAARSGGDAGVTRIYVPGPGGGCLGSRWGRPPRGAGPPSVRGTGARRERVRRRWLGRFRSWRGSALPRTSVRMGAGLSRGFRTSFRIRPRHLPAGPPPSPGSTQAVCHRDTRSAEHGSQRSATNRAATATGGAPPIPCRTGSPGIDNGGQHGRLGTRRHRARPSPPPAPRGLQHHRLRRHPPNGLLDRSRTPGWPRVPDAHRHRAAPTATAPPPRPQCRHGERSCLARRQAELVPATSTPPPMRRR
ncbi:MAG: hypothetical protein AVDCRST_MAG59-1645 [uncultured Thermomicrobiales bacterium]|uniref:Uncharacterized protein n=1 Tax=uncultured Thermomicrobiales bacterium TaxID=1645740 RepID=A0A6J4UJK5_9BACT|nr:MAG: hypothetical protein AVDCRST_MAG59-1645 [uncultured Thermomicrobiales bacterium]